MIRFPSEEWVTKFKDELNMSKDYEEVAKHWEGDFLFVITPDDGLDKEYVFYVDLWHGKCREAYLLREKKDAAFIFKGPYSNWKLVIKKELDPIRGLIRGLFTLDGDSKIIINEIKSAQELVNTASKIPVDFVS
jgi:putative sterol carrier protein